MFASQSGCLMNNIMHLSKVKPSVSYLQGPSWPVCCLAFQGVWWGRATSIESAEHLQQLSWPFCCCCCYYCFLLWLQHPCQSCLVSYYCLLYKHEWLCMMTSPKLTIHLWFLSEPGIWLVAPCQLGFTCTCFFIIGWQ